MFVFFSTHRLAGSIPEGERAGARAQRRRGLSRHAGHREERQGAASDSGASFLSGNEKTLTQLRARPGQHRMEAKDLDPPYSPEQLPQHPDHKQ